MNDQALNDELVAHATGRPNPCELPPLVIRDQGTSRCAVECGCGWRSPTVNDRATALQAHAAHVAEHQAETS
ncbi:MAG: hypothetical protein H6515_13020 [Microthrixaceae bacterium]|nr:hypothetical protein [Microthrixaceae bacterium]